MLSWVNGWEQGEVACLRTRSVSGADGVDVKRGRGVGGSRVGAPGRRRRLLSSLFFLLSSSSFFRLRRAMLDPACGVKLRGVHPWEKRKQNGCERRRKSRASVHHLRRNRREKKKKTEEKEAPLKRHKSVQRKKGRREVGAGFRIGFRAGAGIGFRKPLTGVHHLRADASYKIRLLAHYNPIFSPLRGP